MALNPNSVVYKDVVYYKGHNKPNWLETGLTLVINWGLSLTSGGYLIKQVQTKLCSGSARVI